MADSVRAWHPDVPLVHEVLHARFEHHAYPAHTHDTWTVLLLDDGAVAYDLERAPHIAAPGAVTLLPPHIPHDGRSAVHDRPFRKRVLYLDAEWMPHGAAEVAARRPMLADPEVVSIVRRIHAALETPDDRATAEGEVLALGLATAAAIGSPPSVADDAPLARRLRTLLDDRLTESVTMADASRQLGAHPSHLVRVFSQTYGIAPHRYVVGRRIDLARRLLLRGLDPAHVAVAAGFHDQPHLTRHFRRVLGVTPGAFAAASRAA